MRDTDFEHLVNRVREQRARTHQDRAMLVAISGIDGAGKGFVAGRLRESLSTVGIRAAVIGIDPWLNPPGVRESPVDSGPHFYHHAFDFERLFARLIEPLRHARGIDLDFELGGQSGAPARMAYREQNIDVILLEGIFLLSRALTPRYDLRVWLDCSYQSAFERALARNQEGLSPEAMRRDYQAMYFAAQAHHLAVDHPRSAADVLLPNDDAVRAGVRPAADAGVPVVC